MDPFYRAFEERHRGSRELIKSRLEVYLPFVEPFKTLYKEPEILDLGCGRGEWLELLRHNGFQAKGVDIDEGMLSACRELDLNVRQADALDYLQGLTANKLSVVSAFHVVEHISFEALRQLVDEAYRVLKPGGLLILETPNTENLVVGTSSFYMDPTHQRPLPAQLLTFVVEYAGFARVKTLYLQEPHDLASTQQTALVNVLDGVSPDYAVIAQKKATKKVYTLFDEPFERSYGLRLNALADRYDQQTRSHTQWLQSEWDNAKPRIEELSKKTGQLEAELASEQAHSQWLKYEWDTANQRIEELNKSAWQLETELNVANENNAQLQAHAAEVEAHAAEVEAHAAEVEAHAAEVEAHAAEVEAHAAEVEAHAAEVEAHAAEVEAHAAEVDAHVAEVEAHAAEVEVRVQSAEDSAHHWQHQANEWHERILAIHKSTSWKITKPIRAVRRMFGGDFSLFGRSASAVTLKAKQIFQLFVSAAIKHVFYRPKIRRALSSLLKNVPWLHKSLLRVAVNTGLISVGIPQNGKTTSQITPRLIEGDIELSGRVGGRRRVAVLAPRSASGELGGAERFHTGLTKAIREQGCDVELIYITVDESTFEGIQKGYDDFANLDLRGFDLIVSTKAPSYVARHKNHVLYLQHTIRVFYDMFDEVFASPSQELLAQRDWIIKKDTEAFSHIKAIFSQANEVTRRLELWNGISAEVIHPPIDVYGMYDNGIGDYFYMPGRLHAWKRVDLAIKAIKESKLPMRLLISGTGEAEQYLRDLAKEDSRIEFLGRVDDDRLKALYAGALAVPFLPIREDYGYITIEAFASGKPVITCSDSGEPTFFVKNQLTGLVSEPNPISVCAAFEYLWQHRDAAAQMGKHGRDSISHINWSSVAARLLSAGFSDIIDSSTLNGFPIHRKRIKTAILDMQPIMPAVGGGRLRLLGLYHGLGGDIEARYVGTYDWPGEKYRRHFVSTTLEEINVPLSDAHHNVAADAARMAGGKTVIDMMFARQAHLSPEYIAETLEAVRWADIVVFSHPWVAPLVSDELLAGKTIVYDAHNVESILRRQLLDVGNPFEEEVLKLVVEAERLAGERADLILACSVDDMAGFSDTYGWAANKIHIVPNGVFCNQIMPTTEEEKQNARMRYGIDGSALTAFFIGSDYAPNVEAATFIIENLAPALPAVLFLIGGGVCGRLHGRLPKNVRAIGLLDDEQRLAWLHASDLAVNPMFSGSGTNIKMFDFMAAGLPIVTTATGARGISSKCSAGLRLVTAENMATEIEHLITNQNILRDGGIENRLRVEREFCWEQLSCDLGKLIKLTYSQKRASEILAATRGGESLRVAHLSTVGHKCGIGEYTKNLIDIYSENGIDNLILTCLTPNEQPELGKYSNSSTVAWFFDNVNWSESKIDETVIQRMIDWRADILLIQYHPGFFSGEDLRRFAWQCLSKGIPVCVVVHRFDARYADQFSELEKSGVTLFSHSKMELLEARNEGLTFEFIPLGVDFQEWAQVKSIEDRDWYANPPVIVTTGFLRQHKGGLRLIQAMPKVLEVYPTAILRFQTAIYPSEDSLNELKLCEQEISRLGLFDHILLDTRFLEKHQVLREIVKADLAILPYDRSDEGSSAAAADCIAVGLPLVLSDAKIFDELRDVALTVEPDPEALSGAIIKIFGDTEIYANLSRRSFGYAEANSWKRVAGRLLVPFKVRENYK